MQHNFENDFKHEELNFNLEEDAELINFDNFYKDEADYYFNELKKYNPNIKRLEEIDSKSYKSNITITDVSLKTINIIYKGIYYSISYSSYIFIFYLMWKYHFIKSLAFGFMSLF